MKMRVSAVQYHLHTIHSFEDFANQVEHYVRNAQEYDAEFLLFPELFTTQLMSIGDEHGNALPITALPSFTERYVQLFSSLAAKYDMHLIGGTHIIEENGKLYNTAFLFYPDGRVGQQKKIHITPWEVKGWNMGAGDSLQIFETDKGKVALIICYDIEFPEWVRIAKARSGRHFLSVLHRRPPRFPPRALHEPCAHDRKPGVRRSDRDGRLAADRRLYACQLRAGRDFDAERCAVPASRSARRGRNQPGHARDRRSRPVAFVRGAGKRLGHHRARPSHRPVSRLELAYRERTEDGYVPQRAVCV